ncbi:MAG TPA: hypothetical protein VFG83_13025 [Kofleriaceae bacterium]|nr:hypothetical protein [Kofleriaceae bacterium]
MRSIIAGLAGLLCLGLAPTARADLLGVSAQVQGGGAGGGGLGGAHQDDAFIKGVSGATYGAKVGVEIAWISAWAEHNQYAGDGGIRGTWTQLLAGLDFEFDVGEATRGGFLDNEGHRTGDRYTPFYTEFGLALGFGMGTGQQVDPPLDNTEITDKGFVGQVTLGVGYRLTRVLAIGIEVPVRAAYLFKSGAGLAANDQETQYQSLAVAGLVHLRFDIGLK